MEGRKGSGDFSPLIWECEIASSRRLSGNNELVLGLGLDLVFKCV